MRLEGDTFFATVTLQTPDGRKVELDARPSDAVNLALVDRPRRCTSSSTY